MKTKQRFLSALLMAIVMMAMSPMKMWADENPALQLGKNVVTVCKWTVFNFTAGDAGTYRFYSEGNVDLNVSEFNGVGVFSSGAQGDNDADGINFDWSIALEANSTNTIEIYDFAQTGNPTENCVVYVSYEGETTTISTLPWSNNFDASTNLDAALLGWDMLNLNNAESWLPYLYITTEAPFYSYSGGSLFFQSKENTNSYLILPAISADLSNAEMSFYYNTYGTSETYSTMSVGYLTDINDQSTYTVIKTMDRTDQFTQATVSLATVPSGARIAICHHGLGDSHYLAVDEISIAPAPAALNVGENKDLDILGSITYTFTPTETGYYNFAFSEYGQFESFCIDVTDAAGQHYGYIDIASGMSTFTPLTAEQTYRVRVQAVTTSESGCQGVTLTVTKCDAPTMTAMEGTSAEGTVEADNQIYRSFSLENAASLTIATDADWALLKKNASNVYECVAISIATGTSNTQSLAAGDYAVALSGTDWEEQAYTLTITPQLTLGKNTGLNVTANSARIFYFTPMESGDYTIEFNQTLSTRPDWGEWWLQELVSPVYHTYDLTAGTTYTLSVYGDENGYSDLEITVAKLSYVPFTCPKMLNVGSTANITHPEDYTGQITYKSYDTDVATVDEDGVVTGVSVGYTNIEVSGTSYYSADYTQYNYAYAYLNVNVSVPGLLNASDLYDVLEDIDYEGDYYTLTFADSYTGNDTGISVGSGIELYYDGDGNYVVAPTTAGTTIVAPKDCDELFYELSYLTSITFTNFDTSNVEDMEGMFCDCESLTSLDLSGFDISNVEDMDYMFEDCESLEQLTIGNFDMSNVESAHGMFYGCDNLTTLTMKSLPYLAEDSFDEQFDGEAITVNVVLDDNSVVYTGEETNYLPAATAVPTYTRQMSNEWGTVVVPFAITYSQSNGNYKLYKLSDAEVTSSTGTLTFTEYDDKAIIAAGTPMAIKAVGSKTDGKYTVTLSANDNDVNTAITKTTEVAGFTMDGTYAKKEEQTGIYFIANNKFWYAEDEITINPFRAWFEGNTTNGAKAFNIVVDDETTAIGELKAESLELRDGKFLENNRVIIVKNGKKFNLNGQEIK